MDKKVRFFNCYDFNDELILVEMLINDFSENIDFAEFVVPDENSDADDWQCAYLEQYLNADGTKKICECMTSPTKRLSLAVLRFLYIKPKLKKAKLLPRTALFP